MQNSVVQEHNGLRRISAFLVINFRSGNVKESAWPCIGAFHALRYERAIKAQVEKDRRGQENFEPSHGHLRRVFRLRIVVDFWVRALLDGKKHRRLNEKRPV